MPLYESMRHQKVPRQNSQSIYQPRRFNAFCVTALCVQFITYFPDFCAAHCFRHYLLKHLTTKSKVLQQDTPLPVSALPSLCQLLAGRSIVATASPQTPRQAACPSVANYVAPAISLTLSLHTLPRLARCGRRTSEGLRPTLSRMGSPGNCGSNSG